MTPRRARAAALFVSALLALTGCGTTVTTGSGGPGPSGSPSASPSVDYAALAREAAVRHDRDHPEIAARCAGRATALPPAPGATTGTDPEANKYAENNAFKRELPDTPMEECKGAAHAERIRAALTGAGKTVPHTEAQLRTALEGLGYTVGPGAIVADAATPDSGRLWFQLRVHEGGPCVGGQLHDPVRIETHGSYMEGGCWQPKGGH
ncbi:hypothetical protein ABZY31_26635 [Streptomyces sp. NPDC006529]|uniref:hypothetical protein n=1 Tax=Streptomyces sp. NPDC006529 TaxID=3157177 RepID=UPI0033AE619C